MVDDQPQGNGQTDTDQTHKDEFQSLPAFAIMTGIFSRFHFARF
jgi:hypothetical protein